MVRNTVKTIAKVKNLLKHLYEAGTLLRGNTHIVIGLIGEPSFEAHKKAIEDWLRYGRRRLGESKVVLPLTDSSGRVRAFRMQKASPMFDQLVRVEQRRKMEEEEEKEVLAKCAP